VEGYEGTMLGVGVDVLLKLGAAKNKMKEMM
jgi:hypothetical protein